MIPKRETEKRRRFVVALRRIISRTTAPTALRFKLERVHARVFLLSCSSGLLSLS